MYARITPYQLKPGMNEAATKHAESLRSEIMGLPGMVDFTNVVNEHGKGYIVALVESQEQSEANIPKTREIWGKMADFLEEMPTPEGYDVVAHWKP